MNKEKINKQVVSNEIAHSCGLQNCGGEFYAKCIDFDIDLGVSIDRLLTRGFATYTMAIEVRSRAGWAIFEKALTGMLYSGTLPEKYCTLIAFDAREIARKLGHDWPLDEFSGPKELEPNLRQNINLRFSDLSSLLLEKINSVSELLSFLYADHKLNTPARRVAFYVIARLSGNDDFCRKIKLGDSKMEQAFKGGGLSH